MKQLWAPWRMDYIIGPKSGDCFLCVPGNGSREGTAPESTVEDEQRLIVHRGELAFVILNRYPYASGHLMVVPFRHIGDIQELTKEENAEMMALIQRSCAVLEKYCHPQGINIGVNLGEAAGAGLREHIHFHVVPRWNGDSSFMAVLDDVRIMPEHLHNTWQRLVLLFSDTAA